ncbi:MAG: class B sortase [Firmicutes bacterium]|nr:class B sortase [Bacillota bacterium]
MVIKTNRKEEITKQSESKKAQRTGETIYITRKKSRLHPLAFWCLFIVSGIFLIYASTQLFIWSKDNKEIISLEKEIEKIIELEPTTEQGILINPPEEDISIENNEQQPPAYVSDYWYYVTFPFYNVNFENLIEKNSDTVAYIHINNTNVNYPVVQTTDNDFYLNHAFDKRENGAGWVYMDYRNTLNPMSDNVVIYGHGRKNNTVFGSLKKALDANWQSNKDNFIINLSTPLVNYVYQIFSIYTIQSENYYITTDFRTLEEKQIWLDTMVSRNTAANITASVNVNDKILTLSTCYNDDGIRIVVQAKLIKASG